jgi:alkanesulfonate monooxygenase SsuD/methylene tetrahydromethanopterin reductase-like flavin-dependent oxidoreductase (luciferase family)
MEEAAASSGRVADRQEWRISREIYVGETPQRARQEAREVLGKPWELHQYRNRKAGGLLKYHKQDPSMPDEAVTTDYMIENVWIVGDPAECASRIQQLYDEVGGFGYLLSTTRDPDDHSLELKSLRLLMEEVVPRLQD